MAIDVATLVVKVDTSQIDSGKGKLNKLGETAGKAEKSFGGLGRGIALVGSALAAVGLSRGLVAVKENTQAFTHSISELSAITGATGSDLEFFTEQSREIGKSTTLSASQAATAFQLIASAKPDLLASADALNAVTREAVTLSEAAGIDLPAAAQSLGGALNQFGAGAEEANRFINVLAAGSKMGSSLINETSLALKNSGAAANAAGLSFEETNAAIQALAKGAITGAEAGTGLRNILLILESQTNDRLKPSMVGIADAMQNLADQELTLTEMTDIFGRQNVVAAQTLVDNAAAVGELETAITGTNIAMEQAHTNFDDLEGDSRRQASAMESLSLTIGTSLEPSLRSMTQASTEFITGIDDWLAGGGLELIGSQSQLVADVSRSSFSNWGADITETVSIVDGAFGGLFENMSMGGLSTTEILSLGFGTAMTNIRALVQTITVEAASVFSKIGLESTRFRRDMAEETFKFLAGIGQRQSAMAQSALKTYEELSLKGALGYAQELEGINLAKEGSIDLINQERTQGLNSLFAMIEETKNQRIEIEKVNSAYVETSTGSAGGIPLMLQGIATINTSLGTLTNTSMPNVVTGAVNINAALNNIATVTLPALSGGVTAVGTGIAGVTNGDIPLMISGFGAVDSSITSTANETMPLLSASAATQAELMEASLSGMMERIDGAFADMWQGIFSGRDDFDILDSLKNAVTTTLAEIAHQMTTGPLVKGFMTALNIGGAGGGGTMGTVLSGIGTTAGGWIASTLGIGGGAAAGAGTAAGVSGIAGGMASAGAGTAAAGTGFSLAGVGSSISGALAAVPIWGWAALAAGAAAKLLDNNDGKVRMNAGMLVGNTPSAIGSDRVFDVDAFDSGFQAQGFARRADQGAATEVIDEFRMIDSMITSLVRGMGGDIDLSQATLAGLDQEATAGSSGTFLGLGGNGGLEGDLDAQFGSFAQQLVDHIGGLTPELISELQGARSAEDIISILTSANEEFTLSNENVSEEVVNVGTAVAVADKNNTDHLIKISDGIQILADFVTYGPEVPSGT